MNKMSKLMSKRKWFLLLCFEISYLLLGACFFYHIESREETIRIKLGKKELEAIEDLLREHYYPNKTQDDIFKKLSSYCGKPMHINMSEEELPRRWDFYHSLFFVITVITTIGYGNLAPTTMTGRIVMIFYAIVGMPINGIVMLTLGEYFGERFRKIYAKWKEGKIHNFTTNLGLAWQIGLVLIPALTFFIFIASIIIMIFEQWPYDVAVYYAFVTLTTIGFGDYVAGVQDNGFGHILFTSYQIFLLVWIILGLGYLVMVLGFISRGMKSRKIREIEQLLSDNLKQTPFKFRALKSLVYEILLMRLKPVYKKDSITPIELNRRANSLPDLTLIGDDNDNRSCRKRAMSETNTKDLPTLQRVHSDSNLHLIDKEKTFRSKKEQQKYELLRKMSSFVNSYEARLNQISGGFEGFSDEEILESEKCNSHLTIDSSSMHKNQSTPSLNTSFSSMAKIPADDSDNNQTWCGATAQLKEQEMREKLKHGRARSRTLPVQQEPLLKLPQPSLLSRLLRRNRYMSDSNKDIEKQEIAVSSPQIPKICRQRAQSESQNIFLANRFASQEEFNVKQMARMIVDLMDGDSSKTPTPRTRRLAIKPMQSRRGSLIPPSPSYLQSRRLSLMPSSGPPASASPVVDRPRRFSLRPVINITNTPSPVQRQRMKNERKDRDVVIIEHEQMK